MVAVSCITVCVTFGFGHDVFDWCHRTGMWGVPLGISGNHLIWVRLVWPIRSLLILVSIFRFKWLFGQCMVDCFISFSLAFFYGPEVFPGLCWNKFYCVFNILSRYASILAILPLGAVDAVYCDVLFLNVQPMYILLWHVKEFIYSLFWYANNIPAIIMCTHFSFSILRKKFKN